MNCYMKQQSYIQKLEVSKIRINVNEIYLNICAGNLNPHA